MAPPIRGTRARTARADLIAAREPPPASVVSVTVPRAESPECRPGERGTQFVGASLAVIREMRSQTER
jgi:hypothetical protein